MGVLGTKGDSEHHEGEGKPSVDVGVPFHLVKPSLLDCYL